MTAIGVQILLQEPPPPLRAPAEPVRTESKELEELRLAYEMKMGYYVHEKLEEQKNPQEQNPESAGEERRKAVTEIMSDPLYIAFQDAKETEEEADEEYQEAMKQYVRARYVFQNTMLQRTDQPPASAAYASIAVAVLGLYLMGCGKTHQSCGLFTFSGVLTPLFLIGLEMNGGILDWSDQGLMNGGGLILQTFLCFALADPPKRKKKAT
eukprot:CAMPEP_0197848610 /NCGR_PEP_ID=MMETSP1438-20131217/9324_1 /TAXON_ID=1461541 /ORGANISM="Pterosperma sp., Strain CCMP1384" /LENGTH=209 /DNA_ID=CAMNT_0043460947 /DNA_START=160 /DNA_END=789 /DNA_ORIENTATION=+